MKLKKNQQLDQISPSIPKSTEVSLKVYLFLAQA